MKSSAALPIGVCGGLAVAMFIGICWWFPRHYKKGLKMDMDEIDETRRQRDAHAMRVDAEERGRVEELDAPPPVYEAKQPRLTYIPPVAGY